MIEGSGVQAGGDVNLLADGDVVVKEVQDTYRETTEEIHGAADLNLVVQHQAVEIAKATEGLNDAKDQVKQAEADYRQYQRDRDELETTLAELEADYEAGVPGVTHGDVVELRNLLDDVKGDEEWYIAGIATATANVVSKATLLQQQIAGAGSSAQSFGFNAGLELDIAATKTDSSMEATSSVGSTISGNNINVVTGGDGNSGNTLVQGSALDATQNLNITTGNLDVLASQDSMRSQTDTQSGNIKIAQTFAGAASGPTVNANLNSSQQQDRQTTHTNSSLTADNLNITTTGDTNIVGGNLHGATAVDLDIGGDLTLESVQDRFSGSNKSAGVSGGVSLGGVYTNENGAAADRGEIKTTAIGQGEGVSGANAGVNASSGRYSGTETVLSSITGGTVNVNVDGHTQVTGSVIAAVDSEGNETGELQLSTGSLEIANLTNRSHSSNQSMGVNISEGLSDAADAGDPSQSDAELALNSSNYTYQNKSSQSLDKTLVTIGEGSITVGGEEVSPEDLNRDIDEVNKDIYAVDREKGSIDLTVDHRLLSKDGQNEILDDTKVIVDTAGEAVHVIVDGALVVTDALGITGLSDEDWARLETLPSDLETLNAQSAAREEASSEAFEREFDDLLVEMGLDSDDSLLGGDGPSLPGQLIVSVEQMRSEVLNSQRDGFDPLKALEVLENLKVEIGAIPSTDISNPERQADAIEIITGMQRGIMERTPLAEAVGWIAAPLATRRVAVEAGQSAIEGGTEIVRPLYQRFRNLFTGRGPDAPNGGANRSVDSGNGELDFYDRVDNAGRTMPDTPLRHEAYRSQLRQSMEQPVTESPSLTNLMDELYRPNGRVGSGSTADAVRYERRTGNKVGGKIHTQKAEDYIRALDNWLNANPNASVIDRAAAENVILDLIESLSGGN